MCSQSQATSQPSLPFFPLFGLQYTPSFRNRFSHLQKLWERYFLRCTGCPLHNTIITLCSQNNLVVKDTNNVKGDYSVFIFFYLNIPQMFNILATCNLGVSTKYFYQFHNTFKIKLKTRFHIDSLCSLSILYSFKWYYFIVPNFISKHMPVTSMKNGCMESVHFYT